MFHLVCHYAYISYYTLFSNTIFLENANIISTDNNLPECFIVSHLQNATRIRYSVNAWLRNIREHLTTKMAYGVLSDSNK